jgi:hypothetical protein
MKNEENKGNNANAFTHSTVRGSLIINQLEIRNPTRPDPTRLEFEKKIFDRRLSPFAHFGPFSYFGFETTSQLSIEKFFFDRRLGPFAHLGPFSYFGFETTSQLSVEIFFLIDALAHLGQFSYFGFETTSQLSIEIFF